MSSRRHCHAPLHGAVRFSAVRCSAVLRGYIPCDLRRSVWPGNKVRRVTGLQRRGALRSPSVMTPRPRDGHPSCYGDSVSTRVIRDGRAAVSGQGPSAARPPLQTSRPGLARRIQDTHTPGMASIHPASVRRVVSPGPFTGNVTSPDALEVTWKTGKINRARRRWCGPTPTRIAVSNSSF